MVWGFITIFSFELIAVYEYAAISLGNLEKLLLTTLSPKPSGLQYLVQHLMCSEVTVGNSEYSL